MLCCYGKNLRITHKVFMGITLLSFDLVHNRTEWYPNPAQFIRPTLIIVVVQLLTPWVPKYGNYRLSVVFAWVPKYSNYRPR
jgi:hypothetical protein